MPYIKKIEAFNKMKSAEESFSPITILAHAGWGKSVLVENYFKRRSFLLLSGDSGSLDKMPKIEKIRQGVVVIDGVTWLEDPKSQEYIIELLKDNSRQIVLVGRGKFPGWLGSLALDMDFVNITYQDLSFTRDDVYQLFSEAGRELTTDEINILMEMTEGYPPALKLCLRHSREGEAIDRGNIARIRTELFDYYDETFFSRIKEDARQMLLEVCELKKFTGEMAATIMDRESVNDLLDYCETVGSFVSRTAPDTWMIIEDVREFLWWKRTLLWSTDQRIENNRRIAQWFEKEGRLAEAADFYENVGDTEKIWELLVKNSHLHPGKGQFHALRRHYENLPEEIIIRDPALIAGISLLKSMTLRPEESERWYQELEQFDRNKNNSPAERKKAKAFLCCLDIGLPHRAGKNMMKNMKSTLTLIQEKDMEVPEFSVTDNIPSVIDGGLDYSEWSRSPEQIVKLLGPILEKVLGRHGKGLMKIALAEAGFERGTMSPHEVVDLVNKGIAEAASNGSLETCFAGYGVLIYQDLVLGNVKEAREYLENIKARAEEEKEYQLMPNIMATDALIALYESDYDRIRRWLADTPDVHRDFSIMDRFIYQVKLQCLIAIGSLPEAANLTAYLDWYYREYKRTYSKIENDIFCAMISYRQGRSDWQDILAEALSEAERYHYTEIAAMKGAAALPLLTELKTDRVSDKFLKEVRASCRETALKYPDFMKYVSRDVPRLTAREQEILGLLCAGESMDDICYKCDISYSGLKKHNRNIYAKLGAKNRTEAERIAASMGLVKRQ